MGIQGPEHPPFRLHSPAIHWNWFDSHMLSSDPSVQSGSSGLSLTHSSGMHGPEHPPLRLQTPERHRNSFDLHELDPTPGKIH